MDRHEDWSTPASKAITITLLSPVGDNCSPQELTSFHPDFTYQIFESGRIFGYKNLDARIYFAADDMKPCVEVSWAARIPPVNDVAADNVVEVLEEYLPPDAFEHSLVAFKEHLQSRKPFRPHGNPIHTYTFASKSYTIYHSTLSSPQSRDLLANLQVLLLLYIEGASYIPLDDEEWTNSRWDLFFLYETDPQTSQCAFVGYATAYRYYYFDLRSASDLSRAKLSQFLILPPFQHLGHGGTLYDTILEHYLSDPKTVQIAVEDPSQLFSDLRDIHDLRRLRADPQFSKLTTFPPIPEKNELEEFRKKVKLPQRQFARLLELEMLSKLDESQKRAHKAYRLFVKARLYRQNLDRLAQLERLERVDKLHETYLHVKDDHLRILNTMERVTVSDDEEDSDKDEDEEDDDEEGEEGGEAASRDKAKGKGQDPSAAVEVRPKKRLRVEF